MDTIPPPNAAFSVSTIRPTAWRRACVTCTKAKRQCSKQVPRCRRCLDKGLLCTYPPPRRPEPSAAAGVGETSRSLHLPSAALHLDGGSAGAAPEDVANHLDVSEDPAFAFLQMTEADFDGLALPPEDRPSGGSQQTPAPSDALASPRGPWFLAPESWATMYTEPPPVALRETERSLKRYIEQVQLCMRQWVTEGHSPLHHRELHSFHMPRHTQDAYTAMTMYMSKTCETEATVHRILEDRVSQLLQDQAVEASLGNASGDGLSIFNRLSRVQSLLCYQLIRLFDGDIRMRGQAENLIPTLFSWNKQLLESAKESLGHPERFLASSPFDLNPQPNASYATGSSSLSPKAVWQAWIIAESVRRTWQATNVVQAVYQFFKRGWAECPGHLPSTLRRALWDAPSAYSWTKELRGGKDPLLLSSEQFSESCPTCFGDVWFVETHFPAKAMPIKLSRPRALIEEALNGKD
ncbi:hypothetical protein F5B21DRAFT_459423 [Xylaria acuta]|nr:hypothetical protein F5B21DRAFT_459423 [Xylaria acuta]